MQKEEEDRRVRKTKARIRQALTQLLMKKDLKDISVSELTELADINRGTFYLHYKDIYDLFEQTEEEVVEDFTTILGKYKTQSQILWMSALFDLFQYIAANSDLFIAIFHARETRLLNQIIEQGRPQNQSEWHKLFGNGKEEYYEYYYDFVTFGCVAMLRRWFENGMQESPERMAELAEKLMTNSIMDLS